MIHTIKEEIYISIYLIVFGIYLLSTYDILLIIIDRIKFKKWFKIIIELIFFILQIFVTYRFSFELANGYIPIYFILFVLIGIILYYKILRNPFIKIINQSLSLIIKISKILWRYFVHLLYSKTLITYIKNLIINIICIFKKIKFNKKKQKEKISLDQ